MSVGKSPAGKVIVNTRESQVSVIVVGAGNDTAGAVGMDTQVPEHVKVGLYESACALGAPIAEISSTEMIQKVFRIFQIPPRHAGVPTPTRLGIHFYVHDPRQSRDAENK